MHHILRLFFFFPAFIIFGDIASGSQVDTKLRSRAKY